MRISIAADLLGMIREHGRSDYPYECCGLLIGRTDGEVRNVTALSPIKNARTDSRHNRYLIAPEDMLKAEKDAREKGLDILGTYHSHPDHPARPSEFDRDHAFPWYSYIIVSVNEGKPGDLASWNLREDRAAFDQEEIVADA